MQTDASTTTSTSSPSVSSTDRRASLLDLPPELAMEIFTHCDQADLLNLLTTSRDVYTLSKPVLYQDPTFVTDAGGMLDRMRERPELCGLLQKLTSAVNTPVEDEELLPGTWLGSLGSLGPSLTALKVVTLWGFGQPMSLYQVASALERLPALESLELGQVHPWDPGQRTIRLGRVKDLTVLDVSFDRNRPNFSQFVDCFTGARKVTLNLYIYQFSRAELTSFHRWSSVRRLSLEVYQIGNSTLEALTKMPSLESLDLSVLRSPDPGFFDLKVPSLVRCSMADLPAERTLELALAALKGNFETLRYVVVACVRGTKAWTKEEVETIRAIFGEAGFGPDETHQNAPDSVEEQAWRRR